jgi:hypothetical protein
MSIQHPAKYLLACIEDIRDIFIEEAETADIAGIQAARRRKARKVAVTATAAGAVGIALTVWVIKSKRAVKKIA